MRYRVSEIEGCDDRGNVGIAELFEKRLDGSPAAAVV